MLLPALPEINIAGKRTGLPTETQALSLGAVRFPAFTPALARPFRETRPQWVFFSEHYLFMALMNSAGTGQSNEDIIYLRIKRGINRHPEK